MGEKARTAWDCVVSIWRYEPAAGWARNTCIAVVAVLGLSAPYIAYRLLKSRLMEVMSSADGANVDAGWAMVLLIPATAAVFAAFLELTDFLGGGEGWWPVLAAKSLMLGSTVMIVVVSAGMIYPV